MIKIKFKLIAKLFLVILVLSNVSCDEESLEAVTFVDGEGGTLSSFKAYTIDSVSMGDPYGRIVFWESIDASYTLVQVSLYNVSEDVTLSSAIMSGDLASASSSMIESLYDIENTAEGYDFGEFSTNKFYILSDVSTYGLEALESLDAYVAIMDSGTMVSAGDIGANATPVDEN